MNSYFFALNGSIEQIDLLFVLKRYKEKVNFYALIMNHY